MDTNSVVISGNLTRDPETRVTAGGTTIVDFSIAWNERIKDGEEWTYRPSFFDATIYGKHAETLQRYLRKGMHVTITGRMRQERWETKDGEKRSMVKVIASEVELPPKATQTASAATSSDDEYSDAYGEEIPF